jgi:hypothetical protein
MALKIFLMIFSLFLMVDFLPVIVSACSVLIDLYFYAVIDAIRQKHEREADAAECDKVKVLEKKPLKEGVKNSKNFGSVKEK